MSFETIFVTENPDFSPAVEIQFNQQRLCIIRFSQSNVPEIEFVKDIYVGRDVVMAFPVSEFHAIVQQAVTDLASWVENIADDQA